MPSENKETIHQIPLQTYRYSSEVLSLSLGQGTSEIIPEPSLELSQALDHLSVSPNDKWMWLALLHAEPKDVQFLIARVREKPTSAGLYLLTPYLGQDQYTQLTEAVMSLGRQEIISLLDALPTLYSRTLIINHEHFQIESEWDKARKLNREQLVSITALKDFRFPIPQDYMPQPETASTVPIQMIKDIYDREISNPNNMLSHDTGTSLRESNLADTVIQVSENPVLDEITQGHTPIGTRFCGTYSLAVPWNVDWRVNLDRANYRVIGIAGASGKGLTQEATIASGFMELAERISAIAGAMPNWPKGYEHLDGMVKAKNSEMKLKGLPTIDPNDFLPPAPYQDQEIYWIQAKLLPAVHNGSPRGIWVPAQKVFHFSNLDEPEVVKDSSNGLASGNTLEEAELHALLEILERDGCYTTFTTPQRQFTLPPDSNDQIGQLIAAYHQRGLQPGFIDITTDFGIPTYKAYIQLPDGQILSGSGAHLNGRIALNRAICELGAKCLAVKNRGIHMQSKDQSVAERSFSDIPNFSTGNVKTDLGLVESVFRINGYPIIFADLTRSDVNIPVVRAIIPELDYPLSLTRREVRHFLEEFHTKQS